MKLAIRKSDGILILGTRGSGKTYALTYILNKLKKYKWLVIDPVGAVSRYNLDEKYCALMQVDILDESLDNIIERAFQLGVNVAIDEVSEFPYAKYSGIRKLVMMARNWNIGYVFTSRAPADVHKSIINNSKYILLFHIHETNALKYLNYFLDFDARELVSLSNYEFYIVKDGKTIMRNGNPVRFRIYDII